MNISKRWPALGAGLAIIAVVFSGVGTKYLPEKDELFGSGNRVSKSLNDIETAEESVLINMEGEVPYLNKLPILDGNLFIEQHYSELVFGGINFELVKFAARTEKGEKIEILKISDSGLVLPAFDMPYLEFEYKDRFYALEIEGEIVGPENVSLTYKIKNLLVPTMQLKSIANYNIFRTSGSW